MNPDKQKFTYKGDTYFNFAGKNSYVIFKLKNKKQEIKKDSELLKIGKINKTYIASLQDVKAAISELSNEVKINKRQKDNIEISKKNNAIEISKKN